MATGWREMDGAWYYFDGSGHMTKGMIDVGGLHYYMDPSTGRMAVNTVVDINGTNYQADASGVLGQVQEAAGQEGVSVQNGTPAAGGQNGTTVTGGPAGSAVNGGQAGGPASGGQQNGGAQAGSAPGDGQGQTSGQTSGSGGPGVVITPVGN